MSARARLFIILFLAGFAGVLSFQLVDLTALISMLPEAAGKEMPLPMAVVRILSVVQPAAFVGAAVFVGMMLSPKVGLSAPAAESLASRRRFFPALKPQIVPGLIGGVIGGVAVIASWVLWRPFLPPQFASKAEGFNQILPPITRLLYGGITEEVLLRWGLMTFLVWAGWKVFQRGRGNPGTSAFIMAIILSSVVFGIGHLPLAVGLNGGVAALSLITYVVVANSAFGLIAGYLYWRRGLESAIVAHMTTHGVILTGLSLLPSLDRA